MIDELMESVGFWILAGGGVSMEVLGWIISKRISDYSFPIWQLIVIIIGTIIASAFFALKE
jgi:hypothetical protein